MSTQAEEVLHFWLVETPFEMRFMQDRQLDDRIRQGFGPLHARLAKRVPPDWRDSPRTLLASVIVLDQFSRNLYRDDPRAYANDESARALTGQALEKGWDQRLGVEERYFLYMPLMHSESLEDQDLCVSLYTALGSQEGADFASRHRAQIRRFGRFPQRNEVLGRHSTPDEIEFLERPDARF